MSWHVYIGAALQLQEQCAAMHCICAAPHPGCQGSFLTLLLLIILLLLITTVDEMAMDGLNMCTAKWGCERAVCFNIPAVPCLASVMHCNSKNNVLHCKTHIFQQAKEQHIIFF
jgi:hypothetical protein